VWIIKRYSNTILVATLTAIIRKLLILSLKVEKPNPVLQQELQEQPEQIAASSLKKIFSHCSA
jgi:hypothetical protein